MKLDFKRSLITSLLVFVILSSFAQSPDENPLGYGRNKEQDIDNDLGGLIKQQSKSLWSMDIEPGKYRFNIPIPEQPRQSAPRSGGIIVEQTTSSSSKRHSGGSNDFFSRSKELKSRQGDAVRRSADNMNAWREELARRAEENRRRTDAQNAMDRERGLRDYYNRMSGFHAQNAARDHWMATEGMRHLKEDVHAMDMAVIPEAKKENRMNIMSGKDMANLLKPKEEDDVTFDIIVVERDRTRKNKINVSLNKDKPISLYDEGSYNQADELLWEQSINSNSPLVAIPPKIKREKSYEKLLLFNKSQLNLEGLYLTSLPDLGCVVLLGDSVLLLDSPDLTMLEWGVGAYGITEVVACGSRTFAKKDKEIIEITNTGINKICSFETTDFSIYPETNKTLIVCSKVNDLTIVMRINIESTRYDELLRIPQDILKVSANKNVVLAISGKRIIDITNDASLFYLSTDRINDMCMCQDGLLVATDKSISLLKAKDNVTTFSKTGAYCLWCDGTDIYVLDLEENLIRYSKKQQK